MNISCRKASELVAKPPTKCQVEVNLLKDRVASVKSQKVRHAGDRYQLGEA